MGTTPVKLTRDLAKTFAERGVDFVDAPVARMRQAAKDGTLSIMVGGPERVFERIKPYLSTMGTELTLCGGVGNGQVVKQLNNMVVFMTAHALSEALAIGRRAGVDGKLLFETMAKGSSDSFWLRNSGLKNLVPGHFPEDAFPTDYAIKDISYALELASQGGIDARAAKLTRQVLGEAKEAGYGRNYYPVILKLIEGEEEEMRTIRSVSWRRARSPGSPARRTRRSRAKSSASASSTTRPVPTPTSAGAARSSRRSSPPTSSATRCSASRSRSSPPTTRTSRMSAPRSRGAGSRTRTSTSIIDVPASSVGARGPGGRSREKGRSS